MIQPRRRRSQHATMPAMLPNRPTFRVIAGHPVAPGYHGAGLEGLGFSLNPFKVAQRHIQLLKKTAQRHVSIVKKVAAFHKAMAKRHAKLITRPIRDIRSGKLFHAQPKPGGAPGTPDSIQYVDDAGNPIDPSQLQFYTDENGVPLAPQSTYYSPSSPVDSSSFSFDPNQPPAIDPRLLMTLPESTIRELAQAGALYPGAGMTASALYDRERMLYQTPSDQPGVNYDDVSAPAWTPAPQRTVYGVEHTPTNYAALVPAYYGPESPSAPWMSETEETAWTEQDAAYPGGWMGDEANAGPSFADDYYGSDALSGIYDVLIGDPIKFWTEKWQDAKAKLTQAAVSIAGTSQTLTALRSSLNSIIDASQSSSGFSPDDLTAIERARQKLVALEANQSSLEGRAQDAAAQLSKTASENPDQGLGVFPIVAVGVIIATILGIVAAVVVHTQNVNALANEIQMIASKKISTGDLVKVQSGQSTLPGLPGMSSIGDAAEKVAVLAAVGVVAYLLLKRR